MTVRGPDSTGSTPRSRARLLGRKSGSCMERSCVRSRHSGHRCSGTRHLVRPRRVNPPTETTTTATYTLIWMLLAELLAVPQLACSAGGREGTVESIAAAPICR